MAAPGFPAAHAGPARDRRQQGQRRARRRGACACSGRRRARSATTSTGATRRASTARSAISSTAWRAARRSRPMPPTTSRRCGWSSTPTAAAAAALESAGGVDDDAEALIGRPRPSSTRRPSSSTSTSWKPTSPGSPATCREHGVGWRPHTKGHEDRRTSPVKQIAAGAIGITCAKLGEAEVMAAAGFRDILIANQIVGAAEGRAADRPPATAPSRSSRSTASTTSPSWRGRAGRGQRRCGS